MSSHPADTDREAFLRTQLTNLMSNVEEMVTCGSWQAVVSGNRQVLLLRDALDELREKSRLAAAPPPASQLTEEQLVTALCAALEGVAPRHLRPVREVLMRRLGPPVLTVHEGGK